MIEAWRLSRAVDSRAGASHFGFTIILFASTGKSLFMRQQFTKSGFVRAVGAGLFRLALLWLALCVLPFNAQAAVGSVISGAVTTDRGYSIPLPEGRWRVTLAAEQPQTGYIFRIRVLRNEDPGALVPYLTVRWAADGGTWEDFCNLQADNPAFRVDRLGAQPNQLVQRCARTYASGLPAGSSNSWWRNLDTGFLPEDRALRVESMLMAELTVYRWKGSWARVEAFIRTAAHGASAIQLRDDWRAGRQQLWHSAVQAWSDQYVRRMEESVLNGRQGVVARLEAPTVSAIDERIRQMADAGSGSRPPAAPASPALGLAGAAGSSSSAMTREQIEERIRSMAEGGPSSRPVAPPVSPAPIPSAQPVAAPAKNREQVDERIRQMAEANRTSGSAPAPAPAVGSVSSPPVAGVVPPLPAPPQPQAQTQAQSQAQTPAQAPVPAASPVPGVSAQELARLAAEVARLREELKARPTEQEAAARTPPPAQSLPTGARRLALVIGNDTYSSVPKLQNARTDARAMGDMLTRLGYRVRVRTDLSERAMKDELRSFKSEVQGGDEVLFFFAGHGVQLAGANFLLPTDIRGDSEDQVRDDALPLQKVLDDIQERKARFALAIVDACRDNPFKGVAGRSIGTRGLAPTSAATGQMVMFSAGAGQQALDRLNDRDRDPNGLFTRVLLKELDKPGQSVDRVLRSVRTQVVEMARSVGHEQVPALYDQTVGEFFFRR